MPAEDHPSLKNEYELPNIIQIETDIPEIDVSNAGQPQLQITIPNKERSAHNMPRSSKVDEDLF